IPVCRAASILQWIQDHWRRSGKSQCSDVMEFGRLFGFQYRVKDNAGLSRGCASIPAVGSEFRVSDLWSCPAERAGHRANGGLRQQWQYSAERSRGYLSADLSAAVTSDASEWDCPLRRIIRSQQPGADNDAKSRGLLRA